MTLLLWFLTFLFIIIMCIFLPMAVILLGVGFIFKLLAEAFGFVPMIIIGFFVKIGASLQNKLIK